VRDQDRRGPRPADRAGRPTRRAHRHHQLQGQPKPQAAGDRQVIDVLTACDQASARQFPSRRTFFVSATGHPVTGTAVGTVFNRIWDQGGLPRPAHGIRPRPYDFRHHFAYANIERWMLRGTDVTAMLPYLARYMGHATVESSYYYIHTSPDFMDAYADITDKAQSLLPEVGFE
jgi:integrase